MYSCCAKFVCLHNLQNALRDLTRVRVRFRVRVRVRVMVTFRVGVSQGRVYVGNLQIMHAGYFANCAN